MSASEQLPLTVTYVPTVGGPTTTVTVLGQVLNNGATNWVPSQGHAIYLATTSEQGASTTVLDGETYWLTTGPAVPDQATGVTISVSSPASTSGPAGSTSQVPSGSSSAPITSMSTSMSMSASSTPMSSSSGSMSMSMSAASSSTPNAAPGRVEGMSGPSSKAAGALALMFLAGVFLV